MKENLIVEKSYKFALMIIKLGKKLIAQNEYVLSRQILKSGTSIGANIEEAVGGISKKEFRAKMSISYKEARETHYWLRLLKDSGYLTIEDFNEFEKELSSILRILYKIIESSKE